MERSSLPTSSGKVTVECVDPSDLFSTFKPLLLKYLPLRNLRWKASNRPLRSIKTLQVDLIKDSNDTASAPERRHQIPGLRQTPYLKIYLLRCDDNETYKATCRKQIREWIKSNAQQAETRKGANNQENHDAFEWLLIHVITPETSPVAHSRTPKEARLGTTDSSDSITNKSTWLGKGSSTLLEKLRSDFNGSSKSTPDRVAQIRVPNAGQQLSADADDQFHDLVEKFKVTILASFDLRVRQYEEDIRERDIQRSLPGWNFNTFFILKEGLARGFENVGLFDDALVVYDELAHGLEVIVHEQLEGTSADHGGRFLHFSVELKDKIQACLKDTDDGAAVNAGTKIDTDSDPAERLPRRDYPLDPSKSPFRELILANDISVFDFRLYIFSRQLNLLLRSANALSISGESSNSQSGHSKREEHFLPLAEACQRALDFITSEARTLRHALDMALELDESISTDERNFRSSVISNFVISWTYVSSLQVLAQTGSPNLSLPPPEALPSEVTTETLAQARSFDEVAVEERPRWSLSRTPSPAKTIWTGLPRWSGSNASRLNSKSTNKTGAEELAGARAELYLLARAAVQQIGDQCRWSCRWDVISPADMQEVTLDANHYPNGDSARERIRPVINGFQHLDLRNVFQVQESFKSLFSCLTVFSYRHFLAANRTKSAEKAIAEIAMLKYEAGEYEAAAPYLGRLASFYNDSQWTSLEAMFLELYASCMKNLGRHGEYVSSLIRLLSQIRRYPQNHTSSSFDRYLADLWSFSEKLTTSVSAKLNDFFSTTVLGPAICHYQDRDGFFIPIELSFFGGVLEIPGGLQMTLSSIYDSNMPTITLHSKPIKVSRRSERVELSSNLSVCGWYAVESLQMKVGNIVFLEDYKRLSSAFDDESATKSHVPLRFYVYPPSQSLQATASPAPYLHLAQSRSILIEMKTGWNEIQVCILSMKSGTAGLRLRLHDAKVERGDDSEKVSSVGINEGKQSVRLTDCPTDTKYSLSVPYTVENADVPVINAKLDIEYITTEGNFVYSTLIAVNTILPISVNVQDVFQEHALLSRFTISPATLVPLRVWNCHMRGAEGIYNIESNLGVQEAMDIFPKQPASLMYKFTRLPSNLVEKSPANALALSVKFSCLDEVVLKAMEKNFIACVTKGPVKSLSQPLCAHLLSTFRSQWSALDLEVIGLCHEIEIWPFEDLNWETVLIGFSMETRVLARTWLKQWHTENAVIPIYGGPGVETDIPSRLIVIPVDIPTPPVVVTASLEAHRHREPLIIGDALFADLHLSHTRNWAAPESLSQEDAQMEISFEVLAPMENWVIGGVRKGYFLARKGVHLVPLILIPQRTGHLLLPSIEVKCHRAETLNDGVVPTEATRVPCEIDIKSLAKSVHVVSGLRETVVEIVVDAEAQGQISAEKRSWLVGSKSRQTTTSQQSR